jgi:hypothetical protein
MRLLPAFAALPALCAALPAFADDHLQGIRYTLDVKDGHYRVALQGANLDIEPQPGGGCLVEVLQPRIGLHPVAADGFLRLRESSPDLAALLGAPIRRQGLEEMALALVQKGTHDGFLATVLGLLTGAQPEPGEKKEEKRAPGLSERARPAARAAQAQPRLETKAAAPVAPVDPVRQREVPFAFGSLVPAPSPAALPAATAAWLGSIEEGTVKVLAGLGDQIAAVLERNPVQARYVLDGNLGTVLHQVEFAAAAALRKQAQAPGFAPSAGTLDRHAQYTAELTRRALEQNHAIAADIILGKDADGWMRNLRESLRKEFQLRSR